MKLRKFDIVLVEFPFSDLSTAKLRPALVIRSLPGDNVILCQITTKQRKIDDFRVAIKRTDCQGDIRFDSNVYIDMLFTLYHSIIKRQVGSVTHPLVRNKIDEKLGLIFPARTEHRRAA